MKYLLNHKDGLIELTVKNANAAKNRIEYGAVIARACGDCHRFLDLNSFDSRVRNGKRQIHTKCNQCHRIRKLVKGSMKRFGKDSSTAEIIGIGYDAFIEWLDQGVYKHTEKGLHIDHCIPQSLGMHVEDLKILNHYSNLKLLPGKENIQKSNKYIYQDDIDRILAHHPKPYRILEIIKMAKESNQGIVICWERHFTDQVPTKPNQRYLISPKGNELLQILISLEKQIEILPAKNPIVSEGSRNDVGTNLVMIELVFQRKLSLRIGGWKIG